VSPHEQQRRKSLLLRLRVLLLLGLTAFTAVVWTFSRGVSVLGPLALDPGPSVTVRRHLEALNRGELRVAYNLFSEQYRHDVTFEMYHGLVSTHWRMFRTRRADYERRDVSYARTVLEAHLLSDDGERYLARFTLVRAAGRWWIDDVRWAAAPDESQRIRI
jgi:hypothetical protein